MATNFSNARMPGGGAGRSQLRISERTCTIIAGLLPFTQLVEAQIVGRLYLQDVLTPLLFFALLLVVPQKAEIFKPLRTVILLILLWFMGAIISDLWNSSPFEDLARGWLKIALFLLHLCTIWLLTRGNIRILTVYMFSTGLMYAFKAAVIPDKYMEVDPWKFGMGIGLLLVASSIGVFLSPRSRLVARLPLALAGLVVVISLALNSRSLFAIGLIAILYTLAAEFLSRQPKIQSKINRGVFLFFIVLGLGFSQLLVEGYGELASRGVLGDEARSKYLMQTAGDLSLLQGGRPESLVSIRAIQDSPLVGHGSWARDRYYANMYFDELELRGLLHESQWFAYYEYQRDLIPSHSHILGSWVESGILGVPIWIYALLMAFQALFAVIKLRSTPSLLVGITAFYILWDIPFSPFGADGRILKAAQLCVLVSITCMLRAAVDQQRAARGRRAEVSPLQPR